MADASLPSTITAALEEQSARRRYFLKIEGYRPILWQPLGEIDPRTQEAVDFKVPGGGHPITDHLVALWRFDERAATANAINYSKHGSTLDLTESSDPASITGTIIRARSCPDDADKFTSASTALLEMQEMTICGWFRIDNSYTPVYLDRFFRMGYKDSATSLMSYGVHIYDDSPLRIEWWVRTATSGTTGYGARSGTLNKNQWYHWACRWDGYEASLFIDGVKQTDQDTPSGTYKPIIYRSTGAINPLTIYGTAASDVPTEIAQGDVEDFAIYDKAYSDEWIWRASKSNQYSRYGYACLTPPSGEYTHELNLQDMTTAPSSMSFELSNIDDPINPSVKLFAREFAPQRWENYGISSYLARASTSVTQLDADDTTIDIYTADSLPTHGEIYIANETVAYTSITTGLNDYSGSGGNMTRLNGCVRGEYPALTSSNYGRTQFIDTVTDANNKPYNGTMVSTVPFSWIGREVGFYVTAWDHSNRTWYDEDDAILLWAGKISNTIQYQPDGDRWMLSCEHISKVLDREIGSGLPTTTLSGLNLSSGGSYLYFMINLTGGSFGIVTVTVPTGLYGNALSALKAISDAVNASTVNSFYTVSTNYGVTDGGNLFLDFHYNGSGAHIVVNAYSHHLNACGWSLWLLGGFLIEPGNSTTRIEAPNPPFEAYHPISATYNNGTLYVADNSEFFDDQGDTGTVGDFAYAIARSGCFPMGSTDQPDEKPFLFTYASRTSDRKAFNTVHPSTLGKTSVFNINGFVGNRVGEDPIEITQCYRPHAFDTYFRDQDVAYGYRGPFEILLYSLLSTGTASYNDSTYDVLPLRLSIGLQADLVDTQSFLDADAEVGSDVLAYRKEYVIFKGESWMDLFLREAKLFGYMLAWDNGVFKVVPINARSAEVVTVTLDDSNEATHDAVNPIDNTMDTVVNQWEVKLDYDIAKDKYGPPLVISDENSKRGLGVTNKMSIAHPGVKTRLNAETIAKAIDLLLLNRYRRSRGPRSVLSRTLAPTLMHQVYNGQVVNIISNRHPDPLGSGAMSFSSRALVLSISWNYKEQVGTCKLLIYGETTDARPWAYAAVVDQTATNGGWDAGNYRLTLKAHEYGDSGTDSDDGAAISAGDKILIMVRNPADPTSTTKYSATVASDYETDGAQLLTLTADPFSGGWSATTEYVIIPDVYGTATDDQLAENSYHGDPFTWGLIELAGDEAHRYG